MFSLSSVGTELAYQSIFKCSASALDYFFLDGCDTSLPAPPYIHIKHARLCTCPHVVFMAPSLYQIFLFRTPSSITFIFLGYQRSPHDRPDHVYYPQNPIRTSSKPKLLLTNFSPYTI
uniref:Uncharacterized protein n=1 Tax=Sciurus vulgaris TaxID=55149 RepID=A0A8D2ATJ2_SCIVU